MSSFSWVGAFHQTPHIIFSKILCAHFSKIWPSHKNIEISKIKKCVSPSALNTMPEDSLIYFCRTIPYTPCITRTTVYGMYSSAIWYCLERTEERNNWLQLRYHQTYACFFPDTVWQSYHTYNDGMIPYFIIDLSNRKNFFQFFQYTTGILIFNTRNLSSYDIWLS